MPRCMTPSTASAARMKSIVWRVPFRVARPKRLPPRLPATQCSSRSSRLRQIRSIRSIPAALLLFRTDTGRTSAFGGVNRSRSKSSSGVAATIPTQRFPRQAVLRQTFVEPREPARDRLLRRVALDLACRNEGSVTFLNRPEHEDGVVFRRAMSLARDDSSVARHHDLGSWWSMILRVKPEGMLFRKPDSPPRIKCGAGLSDHALTGLRSAMQGRGPSGHSHRLLHGPGAAASRCRGLHHRVSWLPQYCCTAIRTCAAARTGIRAGEGPPGVQAKTFVGDPNARSASCQWSHPQAVGGRD